MENAHANTTAANTPAANAPVESVNDSGESDRRLSLANRWRQVKSAVATAAAGCGRSPEDIAIIVVTKKFPRSDIEALVEVGACEFGENRAQEVRDKWVPRPANVRLHFIGQLQTNKAALVARQTDVVHSIDRAEVIEALATAVQRESRPPLDCLVQVNLAPEVRGRGGVAPAAVPALCEAVLNSDHLRLRGLMGVARQGEHPERSFTELAEVFADTSARYPHIDMLSAGMSHDFAEAVAAGATHLRIGAAILGSRPVVR